MIITLNLDESRLIMDVKHALSEFCERLEMIEERESSQEISDLSIKFDQFCVENFVMTEE